MDCVLEVPVFFERPVEDKGVFEVPVLEALLLANALDPSVPPFLPLDLEVLSVGLDDASAANNARHNTTQTVLSFKVNIAVIANISK